MIYGRISNLQRLSHREITPDITPPGSLTGLFNTTYQRTSINWTWTDPTNDDFSHVMVWLDGVWKANITKGTRNYAANELPADTEHTIGTHTIDACREHKRDLGEPYRSGLPRVLNMSCHFQARSMFRPIRTVTGV